MIKALIFDFDGLIIDSESSEFETWEKIYEDHGCSLSFDIWASCIGTAHGTFDPFRHLESLVGRAINRDEIQSRKKILFQEIFATKDILPGIKDYLLHAHEVGLAIGLASSANQTWIYSNLERLNLLNLFQCVRTVENVSRSKPHPDLYQSVLSYFKIQGEEAIALEDSPHGVTAAKAAGMFCVAVPNPLTKRLPLSHADLCLNSLAELSLSELLSKLNSSRRKMM
jgi:HAD superfamily hydrolase (TIGR01509 family)